MEPDRGPPHNPDIGEGLILSSFRGLRNAIVCGLRIRAPYIVQGVVYALIFRDPKLFNRVKFVMKQALSHGRNLGIFVFVYKTICWICRRYGIKGGIESWIAGFIGGFIGFGDSDGIVGSVNNQICLYLLARGIEGFLRMLVKTEVLPPSADVKTSPIAFRCFAGFSLALILYLTEYHSDMLSPSFMTTMNNLYYESNTGPVMPPELLKFSPIIILVVFSIFAQIVSKKYGLENIMRRILP